MKPGTYIFVAHAFLQHFLTIQTGIKVGIRWKNVMPLLSLLTMNKHTSISLLFILSELYNKSHNTT